MRWTLLAVCSLALCLRGGGSAEAQQSILLQEPTAQSQPAAEVVTRDATPTFTSRVNLVPLSVVVRDGKGRAVGNLTKEDFRLTDNGKPQFISRFAVERSNAPIVVQKETPGFEVPATPARPEPVLASSFVAYLFDDVHLKFGDLVYIRDAAARHVATALQPTDRVAIYTTSGRNTLEFTDDRAKLQEAIARLRPNPLTGGAAKCPDISFYMAYRIVDQDDQQALAVAVAQYAACSGNRFVTGMEVMGLAQQALSEGEQETQMATRVLKEGVRRLSAMPGQRSIILASPGFFTTLYGHSDITDIISKAITAKVIVNSLDVRGVWAPPGYDASLPSPVGGPQVITSMNLYLQMEATAQSEVLGEVAEGTGGIWIHDNNDLNASFQRLAAAPEYMYVLSYSPDNLKSDGKYHNIKVVLRNPRGLTLQARKGYFAPRRETSPLEQARQDLEDAVFTRDVVKDIPVELHTQFFKPSDDTARLSVLARLDLKGLQFKKAEGRNVDKLIVVSALFDTGGNYISGTQKDVELNLKDETLADYGKPSSSGLTIRTSFDVKPGSYVVRLVVRDGESHLMASENGVVEIP
ncbi:MAG: VWA domain-containing protein [Bryobacteraceae bacterium]|jgi:VWFA-related protein